MRALQLVRPHSGHRRRGTPPLLDAEVLQSTTPPSPSTQRTTSSTRKRPDSRGLGGALVDLLRRFDTLLVLVALSCLLPWTTLSPQSSSPEPRASPSSLPLTFNGYGVNPDSLSMARVYADINANMPRSYWDYDSVNISWGVLENYEVVRKIGTLSYSSQRMCICC
jgi:hypothetical protein